MGSEKPTEHSKLCAIVAEENRVPQKTKARSNGQMNQDDSKILQRAQVNNDMRQSTGSPSFEDFFSQKPFSIDDFMSMPIIELPPHPNDFSFHSVGEGDESEKSEKNILDNNNEFSQVENTSFTSNTQCKKRISENSERIDIFSDVDDLSPTASNSPVLMGAKKIGDEDDLSLGDNHLGIDEIYKLLDDDKKKSTDASELQDPMAETDQHKPESHKDEKINISSSSNDFRLNKTASSVSELLNEDDELWLSMVNELDAFKRKHGHCIVPRGYKENPQLVAWVAEQRKQYRQWQNGKSSKLSMAKVAILDHAGFAWNAQEAAWKRHYENLKAYKNEFGNCLVPINCEKYPQLGLWVKEQRRHYTMMQQNIGKKSPISAERMSLLNELDFCWDLHEISWRDRYNELEDYKEQKGNCLIPAKYQPNPKLGTWVQHQRRQYRMLQEGKTSHMTPSRIEALNRLGFCWSPKKKSTSTSIFAKTLISTATSSLQCSTATSSVPSVDSAKAEISEEGEAASMKQTEEEDDNDTKSQGKVKQTKKDDVWYNLSFDSDREKRERASAIN